MLDPKPVIKLPCKRMLKVFCEDLGRGTNCVKETSGRTKFTIPPNPATSLDRKKLCPVWGRIGLLTLLNPNDGVSELVMMPFNASGPDTLRKLRVWNRLREASLKVLIVVLSKLYVSPRCLALRSKT